jgi:CRISPR-associated protein Cas2
VVVLVLTACPAGLRGHVTRWLLEISAGVFVGHVSARVRDELWLQVLDYVKDGKALLIYTARNEQRLAFRVHRHDWDVVDLDGLELIRRPVEQRPPERRVGWSKASRYRTAARSNRSKGVARD